MIKGMILLLDGEGKIKFILLVWLMNNLRYVIA